MRFYLGTHQPHWLGLAGVPLFVGSLAFLPGQIVGKAYMTALAIPFIVLARRRLAPTPAAA